MNNIFKISFLILAFMARSLYSQNWNNNDKDTVFLGYSSHVFQETNLEDAKAATAVLIQKLIGEWGKNDFTHIKIYNQINEIEDDYKTKKLDLLALTSYEYFTFRKRLNLTPLVAYAIDGESLDEILLVVRKSSDIKSVINLKNKKIIIYKPFNDNFSITEIWFKTLVLEAKENYNRYFADNITENYKTSQCVYDLFFRKTDAIVVTKKLYNTIVLLNPQLEKELKVIDRSNPILYSLLCYTEKIKGHKDFTVNELIEKLCNMKNSATGRQFLSMFRVNSFIPFKTDYLKNTEDLYNRYNELENFSNHTNKKH